MGVQMPSCPEIMRHIPHIANDRMTISERMTYMLAAIHSRDFFRVSDIISGEKHVIPMTNAMNRCVLSHVSGDGCNMRVSA